MSGRTALAVRPSASSFGGEWRRRRGERRRPAAGIWGAHFQPFIYVRLSIAVQEANQPAGLIESAADAQKHRKERGEEEPRSPQKSGLGRHVDIGGVADFGPVDTERMNQPDNRDIPARVP